MIVTSSYILHCSCVESIYMFTRSQVKAKGARKISFAEFRSGLELVAEKKVRKLHCRKGTYLGENHH
jgi:uncharacterized membrane protein